MKRRAVYAYTALLLLPTSGVLTGRCAVAIRPSFAAWQTSLAASISLSRPSSPIDEAAASNQTLHAPVPTESSPEWPSSAAPAVGVAEAWKPSRVLNVCVASIQPSGALCNVPGEDPPDGYFHSEHPVGGRDPKMFRTVASKMGLEEVGEASVDAVGHYQFVCMGYGDEGFKNLMADLRGHGRNVCDIAASAVAITQERLDQGITFSPPTFIDLLAVASPVSHGPRPWWVVLEPFSPLVWAGLAASWFFTALALVCVEEEAIKNQVKAMRDEAAREQSVGFQRRFVHVCGDFTPTTILGFLIHKAFVLIKWLVISVYVAQFLGHLEWQLTHSLRSIDDLRREVVLTPPAYKLYLAVNYTIYASDVHGWDYPLVMDLLDQEQVAAVTTDALNLCELIVYKDLNRSLKMHAWDREEISIAFAFPVHKKHDDDVRQLKNKMDSGGYLMPPNSTASQVRNNRTIPGSPHGSQVCSVHDVQKLGPHAEWFESVEGLGFALFSDAIVAAVVVVTVIIKQRTGSTSQNSTASRPTTNGDVQPLKDTSAAGQSVEMSTLPVI